MRLAITIFTIMFISGFYLNAESATVSGKSGLLQVGNTEVTSQNSIDTAIHIFYRDLEKDYSNFSIPLTLTYGLIENVEIGLAVPAQFGDFPQIDPDNDIDGEIVNVNVFQKIRIIDEGVQFPSLAIGADFLIPTDEGVTRDITRITDLNIIISKTWGQLNLNGDFGYLSIEDSPDGWRYGLGALFRINPVLSIIEEINGTSVVGDHPTYLGIGIKYETDNGIYFQLGGNMGLTDEAGDFQFLFTTGFNLGDI
jgi:hypothetical protein